MGEAQQASCESYVEMERVHCDPWNALQQCHLNNQTIITVWTKLPLPTAWTVRLLLVSNNES